MRPQLTLREWDILVGLAMGQKPRDVAADIGISPQTVKNHLTSIYRKLEVDSLVGAFIALGWLRVPR